jgi:hypothetical protein
MNAPINFLSHLALFEKQLQPPRIQEAFDEMKAIMENEPMVAHVMHGGVMCTSFAHYGIHSVQHHPFVYSDGVSNPHADNYKLSLNHFTASSPFGVAVQFEMVGPDIGSNDLLLEAPELRATSAFNLLTGDIFEIESMDMPVARKAYHIEPGCYLSMHDLIDMTASQSHPSGMPIEGLLFRTQDCKHAFRIMNPVYKLEA